MDVITGEKIQMIADFYIGELNDFKFNPIIWNKPEKHVSVHSQTFPNIDGNHHVFIFCYTHLLAKHFNILYFLLNSIHSEFSMIFHNSDSTFNEEHLHLLTLPKIKKIYTQNIMILPNELIRPIPIGIANSMWKHGNVTAWKNILVDEPKQKTNDIYFYFNIHTNEQLRSKCYLEMKKKKIPIQSAIEYEEYLRKLQTFRYGICPEGNGIDTHRFWECLYLKTIPICTRNPVSVYYSSLYPVVLLDSWEALNINNLTTSVKNWGNYNLLDFAGFALSLF